jgi:citrate synthase
MSDTIEKESKNQDSASLNFGSNNETLPIYDGTVGPEVLDVSKLYNNTGRFTYDPGFTSTASCESKITYIDGDKGILLHRGYSIGELADKGSFIELA